MLPPSVDPASSPHPPQPQQKPALVEPPTTPGTPASYTKPNSTPEVKPPFPETQPRTTFDVDLHNPSATDTYESISLEFYNDRRFANALRAFNRNQPLQGGRMVEIPPLHILRKQFPGLISGGAANTGAQWGAADRLDPPPPARTTFVVPPGGLTMKEIARRMLGSEQRWSEIWDLNPQYSPSALLPAGTELKMP